MKTLNNGVANAWNFTPGCLGFTHRRVVLWSPSGYFLQHISPLHLAVPPMCAIHSIFGKCHVWFNWLLLNVTCDKMNFSLRISIAKKQRRTEGGQKSMSWLIGCQTRRLANLAPLHNRIFNFILRIQWIGLPCFMFWRTNELIWQIIYTADVPFSIFHHRFSFGVHTARL